MEPPASPSALSKFEQKAGKKQRPGLVSIQRPVPGVSLGLGVRFCVRRACLSNVCPVSASVISPSFASLSLWDFICLLFLSLSICLSISMSPLFSVCLSCHFCSLSLSHSLTLSLSLQRKTFGIVLAVLLWVGVADLRPVAIRYYKYAGIAFDLSTLIQCAGRRSTQWA